MTKVVADDLGAELRDIERFLFDEAELLDSWCLTEWLALFAENGRYLVPSPDEADAEDSVEAMFVIADDRELLAGRVQRLESGNAFVEEPHSHTRHLVTNVRADALGSDRVVVQSNFAVYRTRRAVTDVYVGRYRHVLARDPEVGYRIEERKATLDAETLRPQGKISFIL